jgi:hypothetical protein
MGRSCRLTVIEEMSKCPRGSSLPDRGRRSPAQLNLAEGKVVCVMEAPSQDAIASWFKKMNMPCDDITPVELEGDRGMGEDSLSKSEL